MQKVFLNVLYHFKINEYIFVFFLISFSQKIQGVHEEAYTTTDWKHERSETKKISRQVETPDQEGQEERNGRTGKTEAPG